MSSIAVGYVPSIFTIHVNQPEVHWLCGKLDCRCDEEFEQARDDHIREVASEVLGEYEQDRF